MHLRGIEGRQTARLSEMLAMTEMLVSLDGRGVQE